MRSLHVARHYRSFVLRKTIVLRKWQNLVPGVLSQSSAGIAGSWTPFRKRGRKLARIISASPISLLSRTVPADRATMLKPRTTHPEDSLSGPIATRKELLAAFARRLAMVRSPCSADCKCSSCFQRRGSRDHGKHHGVCASRPALDTLCCR